MGGVVESEKGFEGCELVDFCFAVSMMLGGFLVVWWVSILFCVGFVRTCTMAGERWRWNGPPRSLLCFFIYISG